MINLSGETDREQVMDMIGDMGVRVREGGGSRCGKNEEEGGNRVGKTNYC